MKPVSIFLRLLITLSTLLSLTIAPALSDNSQVKTRSIRVTTGIGSVQGWEQSLVRRNPNLSRWHWDPIYYYNQGYSPITQRTTRTPLPSMRTGKQSHTTNTQVLSGWHDNKPIHAPYSPQAMAELRGRLTVPTTQATLQNQSVLGKLMSEQVHAQPIASYNNVLPERNNSLDTALKYRSEKTDVYGQVLNAKSSHSGSASRGKNGAKKNK